MILVALMVVVSLVVLVGARVRSRGELEPPPPAVGDGTTALADEDRPSSSGTTVSDRSHTEVSAETTIPAAERTVPSVEELEELLEIPEQRRRPSFRERLARARDGLTSSLSRIARRDRFGEEDWEELEDALIAADVGVATAGRLVERVRERAGTAKIRSFPKVVRALRDEMIGELSGKERALERAEHGPTVWLFVGVNGVGKTTTIAKVGRREIAEGRKVIFAAGDTFRAAATEQLESWAERVGASVVSAHEGADPASVVYDAIEAAAARGSDLVLADTAGRLHTRTNLMEELKKVRRVAEKGAGTVCEVFLVVDATTGQNGLAQAKTFAEAVGVTGVVLTKLDGSAKGGIVFSIESELGIPVKLVGLGEGPDDLVEFDPVEFVDGLLADVSGTADEASDSRDGRDGGIRGSEEGPGE